MATTAPRQALTAAQIHESLCQCPGWRLDSTAGCIVKSWRFDTFLNVMKCLAEVATYAEHLDHHPHITTCYTHLQIQLSTHDVQGLTSLDFKLAEAIDQLIEHRFITTKPSAKSGQ